MSVCGEASTGGLTKAVEGAETRPMCQACRRLIQTERVAAGGRGLLRATHESDEIRLARMRWREGRGDAAPPMAAWTLFHGLRFISAWNNGGLGAVGNHHIAIPSPVGALPRSTPVC